MSNFDEAIYETGINWLFFQIRVGNVAADFRIHLDDNSTWKFFELLNSLNPKNLNPSSYSDMTFRFGSSERKERLKLDDEESSDWRVPSEFDWLNKFFEENSSGGCRYHGVTFRRVM